MLRALPPGWTWSIGVAKAGGEVAIEFGATGPDGQFEPGRLRITRDQARELARQLNAAAGDGTERTFTPEAAAHG
ncbi:MULTISPECIES: hypothetical protein [Methylobacterium]|uniref:DUF2188 domain-containing protein n=2 Tax=Pseudomonadota TaxID=1224 RepID=A0ABQ4SX85_9HYPH|nr:MULTISPECIES: hypothetical protein [Methylobacterium]PIU08169.1 MAG: hypothetical protein COT56_02275 [Methylobacterium sp. CG09_land_8_20_14_0_10_71_15]PIU15679.1 MAG: hypothetical protein COT28_03525 [Methylobacterium sp. CG08_land_8_20_14_0_20_71_15]GBU17263.1 hypothetical protein AwMethylo_14780 [Methylobacterium sp.]GJE07826.1 hypothetical protein AOPFMNJM_3158 [Methylobacterium jeotgali]